MPTTASNKVREAAKFIVEKKAQNPDLSMSSLIDEAGMRYNLTPLETESLTRILIEEKNK